ncbi:MAG: hypothetical protein K2X93_07815 [Candidatus Obscuribacterales bacterium]|nr:hypothetical protein [Candidatus Obscuribacterales bacterium]
MPTPNGFGEMNGDFSAPAHLPLGEHVFQEGYGSANFEGDGEAIMEILEANNKLVMQYRDQLCNHFSSVLSRVPQGMQDCFIESLSVFNDKNDVVYQGMRQQHEARMREIA